MISEVEPSSFRDPSGFVFSRGNTLFRQVQHSYRDDYDRLMQSGLYQTLVGDGLLIPHTEVRADAGLTQDAYRVLSPEKVPFISYPYEWCFSQLRDAALATLNIQKQALGFGMILKDASAYNIQFLAGRPVLIDTLSFEAYNEGRTWNAYRQFCQHFLAPLALMSRTDIRLSNLLRTYLDGIPLDLASRLLPGRTWFDPGLLVHVHLHGKAQKRYGGTAVHSNRKGGMSRTALLGLIDSLEVTVRKLAWRGSGTVWADYYDQTNYSEQAMEGKRRLVADMLDSVAPSPRTVWDIGANTGEFSRLASERGAQTIAWDIDPGAVEKNYLECRALGETRLLPLLEDLTNPSPDLGWALQERRSLMHRGRADVVLALALVHHLGIGANVPLGRIARFFESTCKWLIVEFVPKSDSQAQRLLAGRDDIFVTYSQSYFESEFCRFFEIVRSAVVPDSERTLYLMRELAPANDSLGANSTRNADYDEWNDDLIN